MCPVNMFLGTAEEGHQALPFRIELDGGVSNWLGAHSVSGMASTPYSFSVLQLLSPGQASGSSESFWMHQNFRGHPGLRTHVVLSGQAAW